MSIIHTSSSFISPATRVSGCFGKPSSLYCSYLRTYSRSLIACRPYIRESGRMGFPYFAWLTTVDRSFKLLFIKKCTLKIRQRLLGFTLPFFRMLKWLYVHAMREITCAFGELDRYTLYISKDVVCLFYDMGCRVCFEFGTRSESPSDSDGSNSAIGCRLHIYTGIAHIQNLIFCHFSYG